MKREDRRSQRVVHGRVEGAVRRERRRKSAARLAMASAADDARTRPMTTFRGNTASRRVERGVDVEYLSIRELAHEAAPDAPETPGVRRAPKFPGGS
jgi:hypothetical protein